MRGTGGVRGLIVAVALGAALAAPAIAGGPSEWVHEFPTTDFDNNSIDLDEIITDGPRRDSIPPIDNPVFVPAAEAGIGPDEPVLSVVINGDARAYPLSMLLWHEIVNDTVGGVPILVSFCPLCASGVVFDRRKEGRQFDFGNTGRIRHFDMVMYDHQTESFWQQFLGEAIVGELTGVRLDALPSRLESLDRFRARAPEGKLLIPNDPGIRPYGTTPYAGYEGASPRGFPYPLPDGLAPFDRIVIVGDEAWPLDLVRERQTIETDSFVISWAPGQNSMYDTRSIERGGDIGNVIVQRPGDDGPEDIVYDVSFAFAFAAFVPAGTLHLE
jgi:hypothetical protein